MYRLFTPLSIGPLALRNRIVRSATGESAAQADTGCPTPAMAAFYRRLAAGGTGLVVTGHTAVSPEGRCHARMTAFTSAAFVPGFRALAQACHEGGAAVVCQLNHGGRQVNTAHPGIRALGPSLDIFPEAKARPDAALTEADIARLIADFARAAGWCREAGFDGIQIHSAHGYLVSQFNSPLTNRRTDRWGGSSEARREFLLAVYRAIRAAVGPGYPILVKQNAHDAHPSGLQLEDAMAICRELDEAGIAAIELSGGISETIPVAFRAAAVKERGEAVFFEAECRRVRAAVRCPLILTGGIRTLATAERLLTDGVCDAIGLCRPLIREPDLPALWRSGAATAARCTSCGGCRATPEDCNQCCHDA
jgi:2,4-dienoyl-CoA reductase-like NADH-dependent reductase (Old Yellow Enzyme family)